MSVDDRISSLTPEQRALFEKLRKKKAPPKVDLRPPPVARRGEGDHWPLSFDQERLWFLYSLDPQATTYNIDTGTRLAGPLEIGALHKAFREIVRRHEAWRTRYPAVGGRPVQVIEPEVRLALPVIDMSALPEERREPERSRRFVELSRIPFDLERGPVVQAALFRLADEVHDCLLAVHHIATDWVTFQLFWSEIAALYQAFSAGRASPLPELPVQYADFALWQREWLQGEVLETLRRYWVDRLTGVPLALDLPTDRPRPVVQETAGDRLRVHFEPAKAAALKALSRREGVTLFMTMLGLYQAMLSRWSGQETVLVGTANANRNRTEIEPLFGFFLTQLVFCTDLGGDPTFRDLLRRVRQTALGAYAHQELPFGKLVEALQPERDLSRNPVTQVSLLVLDGTFAEYRLPNLKIAPVDIHDQNARFDQILGMWDAPTDIYGWLEFQTSLWDKPTVARMLEGLYLLAEGLLEDPDRRLSEVAALSAAARHQVIVEAHEGASYPFARCALHELFEIQAARRPEAVAVVCGEETATYGELDRRANRLAHRLRAEGVGPEVRVGLSARRSIRLLAGLLAILKAGGAYVPLDPDYPPERLAFLREDSGVSVVLTDERPSPPGPLSHTHSPLPGEGEKSLFGWGRPSPGGQGVRVGEGTGVRVLSLDALEEPGETPEKPLGGAGPDNLAYIIYTSGSTGRPKGVLVTHGNVARLLSATAAGFGFGERDVWTLFHSFAFDFSVWEIWGALAFGGRLVVVPYWVSRSPQDFHALLRKEGVTVLNQTPSAFRQLAQVDSASDPLTDLRLVVFGGEALDVSSLGPWFARYGDEQPRLVNMYGITETTVHVTRRPLFLADLRETHRSPIGLPIADLRAYVLDAHGSLAPIGVPGELQVGGPGLARGYHGRPDLTAERFVPDPYGGEAGARLYRTGDRVRHRRNELDYLGRIDRQVKVRGFRIELGEVEAALARHPGIRNAVVVAQPEPGGGSRLVAFIVPRKKGEAAVSNLRAGLARNLPEPMLPSAFVEMDDLPLTPTGKIDRRALAAVRLAGAGAASAAAPRTPTEELLADLWSEVLGVNRSVPRPGPDDDFFALGGHSLLATQLAARVRDAFGVELPIQAIFQAPLLAAQAARIAAARAGGETAESRPIHRLPRSGAGGLAAPLSFAQERLWFLDRLTPGSPAYNIPLVLRIRGELNVPALARTFSEIVRRHEALRTVFEEQDGKPVQVVLPAAAWPMPVLDLSADFSAIAGPEAEARRLAADTAVASFDLERGPLLRTRLLRLGPDDHQLLLTFHHAVADLWSLGVLVREVAALYPAAASSLPELPVQYADFAVWQREWLCGETLERQLAFWRGELAGAPAGLELPADRPRPETASLLGASRPFVLDRELTQGLAALGRKQGATLFMTLTAAFAALLSLLSGQSEVVLGAPIANRRRPELEGLIGMFVNTLALRIDPAGGAPTFAELVARVRRAALAAYDHQDVPFERVVEELQPPRDRSRHPLFQAVFALQNAEIGRIELPGLTLEPVEVESPATQFDLTLSLFEHEGGLAGRMEYALDLFDAATIERWLEHLKTVIAGAADPLRPVAELALLSDAERQEAAAYWSRTVRSGLRLGSAGLMRAPYATPRSPSEELLAGIWSDVLTVDRPSRDDDFFALGGHSLLATQLTARVRAAFGVDLPIQTVFEAPVLAAQAARIEAARSGGEAETLPIPRLQRSGSGELVAPLSYAQERLWFLDRLAPGSPAYNIPLALRIRGELDVPALERTFSEIVRRHESLRTTFAEREGKPVQVVAPAAGWPVTVFDLSAVADPQAEAFRLAAAEAAAPFDLARGPLLRTRLLRLEPGDHVLLLTLHHTIADLWSLGVLVREVAALYRSSAAPERSGVPEPVTQYADFSVWQREWLTGEVLERQLEFWRAELAGAPAVLDLPTDRPRPAVQSLRGASRPFAIGSELAQGLAALGRRQGATLFMTVTAALAALLSHLSGQSEVVLGAPVANRRRPELEGLIGMFVNTLALRVDPAGGAPAFAELLARVRRTALAAYDHQDVPFERVVEDLQPPRDRSRHPLFQAVFAMQNAPVGRIELPGLTLEPVEVEGTTAKFDLTLSLFEDGDGFGGRFEYASDLFDEVTIDRWLGHLATVLHGATGDPLRPVADLGLLSEVERREARSSLRLGLGGARLMRAPYAPPRTPIEEGLVEVCAEVLGLPQVGIHDNFFSIGGHSLLATQVSALLRDRWGIEVPLAMMLDAADLAELAERLIEQEIGGTDDAMLEALLAGLEEQPPGGTP